MQIIKHFKTITKHKYLVGKYCFKLGLYWQGIIHDLSKYSFTEFYNGAKYYQGYRSPIDQERAIKGYSEAWLHHKRNKHHIVYWNDIGNPVPIPKKYIKEMVCDRIAAGMVYCGKDFKSENPLNFFLKGKEQYNMNQESKELLITYLTIIKDYGVNKGLKKIKSL